MSTAWWAAEVFLILLGVVSMIWDVAKVTLRQTDAPRLCWGGSVPR